MKIPLNLRSILIGEGYSDYFVYLCIVGTIILTSYTGFSFFLIPLYFVFFLFLFAKLMMIFKYIQKLPAITCDEKGLVLNFVLLFKKRCIPIGDIDSVDVDKMVVRLCKKNHKYALTMVSKSDLLLLKDEIIRIQMKLNRIDE